MATAGSRSVTVVPAGGAIPAELVDNGHNARQLSCPHCNCKVLPAGRGKLHERPAGVFLHHDVQRKEAADRQTAPGQADVGALEYWFWLVEDMWHFDNIGFSRDVAGKYKYLTCAECEAPILGIQPDIACTDELLGVVNAIGKRVGNNSLTVAATNGIPVL